MERKKTLKKPVKSGLLLMGAASQMGLTIYLFVLLGKWLDNTYNRGEKGYVVVATLTGVGISFYFVLKLLKSINHR